MKKFFCIIFSYLLWLNVCLCAFIAEDITFSDLANNNWTDHVKAFKCLFKVAQIENFLEFGMGRGTKYFLDNCQNVTSIEINIESRKNLILPWFSECIESYQKYSNWEPLLYEGSKVLDFYNLSPALNYWGQTQSYLPDFYNEFIDEIHYITNLALSKKKYDCAFVDPGIFTRADFVIELFDKVDIIVAHDTFDNLYGWTKIPTYSNYERINFPYGCGTTFWINKNKSTLIENLKNEINNTN